MRNENIARILKYYRQVNNLSVQEVSNKLSQAKLKAAVKTIYAWESGRTQPDADTLLYLCKIYNIDNILDVFGYNEVPKSAFHITEFEKALILAYRKSPDLQPAIEKLLGVTEPLAQNKKPL